MAYRAPRIASVTAAAPTDLLDKVWEYSLFEALYGRRSRRFALGFAMSEGPFKYRSQRPPLPLSDLEIAERMQLTRQQVINLRKCARERLRRRMGPD